MKKTLKNCVLSLAVLMACSCAAFADGNAFTPLNFDDTAYGTPVRTSATATTPAPVASAPKATSEIKRLISKKKTSEKTCFNL